ncbi:uncharacterized protein isoform X2 [Musca autumnalis]|uniref:uncharacterized protein isoform X2 n=1 Tax=Musca autumnalis TaxID=221902 RepID=UPI003CFA63F4
MLSWFNRTRTAIIIGCLDLFIYSMVAAVTLENLEYDRFSQYDYDDYSDVYKSYEEREHRKLYCTIYVIMCAIMVLVSLLLIWGVLTKRPACMSPWLLGSFIVLIYSSIVVLDDIFLKASFDGVAYTIVFFTVLFIVFGFQTFCLALVYSLYRNYQLENVLQHFRHQLYEEIHKEYMEVIALKMDQILKSDSKIDTSKPNGKSKKLK